MKTVLLIIVLITTTTIYSQVSIKIYEHNPSSLRFNHLKSMIIHIYKDKVITYENGVLIETYEKIDLGSGNSWWSIKCFKLNAKGEEVSSFTYSYNSKSKTLTKMENGKRYIITGPGLTLHMYGTKFIE
jgi:hypothetical protein